jgi:transposase-like protein
MIRPGRERLSGQVEVDETYIGGLEEGVHGRQTDTKALVIIACEERGRGVGRIRLRHIPDASRASIQAFIQEAIEPGSVVHTDGWEGYGGVKAMGYKHKVTVLSRRRQSPSDLLPRVHLVASLLKRWLLGTHQGAVSREHLAYYLDEFTFRFNRRKSESRGNLFHRLIQQAEDVGPAPYTAMVKCYVATKRRKPQTCSGYLHQAALEPHPSKGRNSISS